MTDASSSLASLLGSNSRSSSCSNSNSQRPSPSSSSSGTSQRSSPGRKELEEQLRQIFQDHKGVLDPASLEAARRLTLELVHLGNSNSPSGPKNRKCPSLSLSLTDDENEEEAADRADVGVANHEEAAAAEAEGEDGAAAGLLRRPQRRAQARAQALRHDFRDANVAPLEKEVVSPLYWLNPPPQLSPPKASARKVPLAFPAVTAHAVLPSSVAASSMVAVEVRPCYAPVMVEGGRPSLAY